MENGAGAGPVGGGGGGGDGGGEGGEQRRRQWKGGNRGGGRGSAEDGGGRGDETRDRPARSNKDGGDGRGGNRKGKGGKGSRGGKGGGGRGHGDIQNRGHAHGGRQKNWPVMLGLPPEVAIPGVSGSALDQCVLCCEDAPSYIGIGRCRHPICWVCTLRMRTLARDNRCPVCKDDLKEVLLTDDSSASLEMKDLRSLHFEQPTGIYFADETVRKAAASLLSYRCRIDRREDRAFRTLWELEDYLWKVHWRQLCRTCLRGRPAFMCEQIAYDSRDIERHCREGDKPHMLDDDHAMPPVPAHPLCEFCNERFYNEDALLSHMHKRHHLCNLCDRMGRKNEFYANWRCLSLHYQEKHYVCAHKDCVRGGHRLIAFADEEELSIHYLAEHNDSSRLEKGRAQGFKLQVGQASYADEQGRGKGSSKGREPLDRSAEAALAPVRFMWPPSAKREDWKLDGAGNEELGDDMSDAEGPDRFPEREIIPLLDAPKRGHAADEAAEQGQEEAEDDNEDDEGDQEDDAEEEAPIPASSSTASPKRAAEEAKLRPELDKLDIDSTIAKDGPRAGAQSCLSALHAVLRVLVKPSLNSDAGDLRAAIRKLSATEVEGMERMRVHLDDGAETPGKASCDWEPLERILGLRPLFFLKLGSGTGTQAQQASSNSRSGRQAIGPRQGPAAAAETAREDQGAAWQSWKMAAQAAIQAMGPEAQQRVLRYVQLCVERRSELDRFDAGVPDWEDENTEQSFPALGGGAPAASGKEADPDSEKLPLPPQRPVQGWSDMRASAQAREAAQAAVEHFPSLGGGGGGVSASQAPGTGWGRSRQQAPPPVPAAAPATTSGRQGSQPTSTARLEVPQAEAFPTLGGGAAAVSEPVKWGAPSEKTSAAGPAASSMKEITMDQWVKPKVESQQPKEFEGTAETAFPTLGGKPAKAVASSWGQKHAAAAVAHSSKSEKASAAKEARAAAAAKEAAAAIAEAKASKAPVQSASSSSGKKADAGATAKDAPDGPIDAFFPELFSSAPSAKSSASKASPQKEAPKAKAQASKASAKPGAKLKAVDKVQEQAVPEQPPVHLHADEDLVLISSKGQDDDLEAAPGKEDKKKKANKKSKNVIPASEWFKG